MTICSMQHTISAPRACVRYSQQGPVHPVVGCIVYLCNHPTARCRCVHITACITANLAFCTQNMQCFDTHHTHLLLCPVHPVVCCVERLYRLQPLLDGLLLTTEWEERERAVCSPPFSFPFLFFSFSFPFLFFCPAWLTTYVSAPALEAS